MMMPLVHWLPKGRLREEAIKVMLRLGAGASYFTEYRIDQRSAIFATFSLDETFYRPVGEIRRIFRAHGFASSVGGPSQGKLRRRLPGIARPVAPALAPLYRTFGSVYLETVRNSAIK